MTQSWRLEFNGAQLAGESAGAGTAVIFLHAGVADRRMWYTQMAALASDFQIVAYDRRGFGRTTTDDVPFSHVDDLSAVFDDQGITKAVLIGCSMGGRLALEFALAHPGRTTGLFLIAPSVSGAPWPSEELPVTQEREAALDTAEEAGDLEMVNELEAILWLDGPDSPAGRVSGATRELFLDMNGIALSKPELTQEEKQPPVYGRAASIAAPTHILCGDLDYPGAQQSATLLSEAIAGARLRSISGTAHLPNLERPDLVNELLLEFLGL